MTEQQTDQQQQQSLGTAAARNLATTTKSVPQMQGISSRWLLKLLPWVQCSGGAYRVNRRLAYTVGDGRIEFVQTGADVRPIPLELGELPVLRGYEDEEVLGDLAGRFEQHEYEPGEVVAAEGRPADTVVLIAHGKLAKVGRGEYGGEAVQGVLADGDFFGHDALHADAHDWPYTVRAVTAATVLTLSVARFQELADRSDELRAHVAAFRDAPPKAASEEGEAEIAMVAGHEGEPALPGTFVDYEPEPREYELSVAQTVLRVHTRVADLFNDPMDQVQQQLRLTTEALRERQEHELVNNRDFGLLANADLRQRVHTRSGPPTPDDMDELLTLVWKEPAFFLAHPRAIAAFGRECSRQGVYPEPVEVQGHHIPAWRGVPIFPCNKIPVSETRTSSIMLMRTGEEAQGVIGLHRTGLKDEVQPGLVARFMNIDEKAIMSYLVSAYYSAAVLVPDALAVLESVEIGVAQ
ncbi:family 2B encapsulin nanocompartment shell protein [Actinomadura rupiterrae]|uniref:family 2B encapsulin nanocompartment shell protein n=1 Tax=Actinomadura rupiterrae TaxID=559627 RepID=UPI0020A267B9|nr:family 2B encapsulin nanocompartment shell protein [Actinomadura rupiterrae]MCP2334757.1 hypothetical protein [Actinomadura rupiterrae]